MEKSEILRHVDHTLLAPAARWKDIQQICDDSLVYHTASVCIPPVYVRAAREYLGSHGRVCTVIGFPNGYSATESKEFETKLAIESGADEIDMVIHIGSVKAGRYDLVEDEIRRLRAACGDHVLKVIIETCLLTEEEKIRMCRVVTDARADYIKTSTGFAGGGATFEDVALFAAHVGPGVKIKAAGGIRSFADAERFLQLGADRLGTSRLVKLAKEQQEPPAAEAEQ